MCPSPEEQVDQRPEWIIGEWKGTYSTYWYEDEEQQWYWIHLTYVFYESGELERAIEAVYRGTGQRVFQVGRYGWGEDGLLYLQRFESAIEYAKDLLDVWVWIVIIPHRDWLILESATSGRAIGLQRTKTRYEIPSRR